MILPEVYKAIYSILKAPKLFVKSLIYSRNPSPFRINKLDKNLSLKKNSSLLSEFRKLFVEPAALFGKHREINSLQLHKLIMGTRFSNGTLVQNNYPVSQIDIRKPVAD